MQKRKIKEGAIYKEAIKFLLNQKEKGITRELLDCFFKKDDRGKKKPDSLNGIYLTLLKSAQNAQGKSKIIGKSLGEEGFERLGRVLGNFDPCYVKERFTSWETLFNTIQTQLHPRGKVREGSLSTWPNYCKTIIDSANFLSSFRSAEEFYRFIDPFANHPDPRVHLAVPILLADAIRGIGYALACDFLMALGYRNYGKPDVHIKNILVGLGMCERKDHDYDFSLALNRIAEKARVSPRMVDRTLWLIGSGNFKECTKSIGKNGRLPGMTADFIRFARQRIYYS
ncbi:MAG: hypothetical protein WC524_00380 [Candidatus Aminicenantales bacterium]